jgi:tetratricopeptide (TPR) repeat protein
MSVAGTRIGVRILLVMLLASGPAVAGGDGEPQPANATAPQAEVPPEAQAARATALALFQRSLESYRRGDFREAITLLEQAYATFPEPVLLYNLARAHESLGDARAAVDFYARYLGADTSAPDRADIARRVEKLRGQIDPPPARHDRAEDTPLVARPVEPAPAVARGVERAPWALAGGGVLVAAAGGGVLWTLAVHRHDDAQAAVDRGDVDRGLTLQGQAERYAGWTNVAVTAGAVLAVAGVVWGLISLREHN